MKLYMAVKTDEVIIKALLAVVELAGHIIVKDVDDAELVLTNKPDIALRALKDSEEVKILLVDAGDNKGIGLATESLRKAFGARVDMGSIVAGCPVAESIVNNLLKNGGK